MNEGSFAFADRTARKNERTDAVADGSAKMKQGSFGTAERKNRLYNLQNTKRIMAELNRRNIHDVANAFHFNTVERILTLVMSSGLRETFRPLGALAEELMRRFNIEDAAYKRSQKNFASDDIKDIDKIRDKYAQFLKTVLTAFTSLPEGDVVRQAEQLVQVFKDFQWRSSEAYLAETAKLDNMLQEWDKEQQAAWLAAMGLSAYVEKLRNANAQVKQLISGRQGEQSMVVCGELRAAREAVDETLQQLLRYIDALNVTTPSDELTDLILKINEAFRYMDAQIAAGKKKSSGDEDGNGSGSGGNGGGSTVISNGDTIHGLE